MGSQGSVGFGFRPSPTGGGVASVQDSFPPDSGPSTAFGDQVAAAGRDERIGVSSSYPGRRISHGAGPHQVVQVHDPQ